jgi:hypothetical protein
VKRLLTMCLLLSGCATPQGSSFWNLEPCQSMAGTYDQKCLAKVEADREVPIREYFEKNPGEKKFEESVRKRKAEAGMLEETLILSWGRPERVNETITTRTNLRQLVYKYGQYVYIANGRVSAFQDLQR